MIRRFILTLLLSLSVSQYGIASGTDSSTNTRSDIPGRHTRFAWGIDAGSAIDMTGNDMSAVDISGYFGYSGSIMRILGVGASIDMMVSSGSNIYPVYAILRTDFCKRDQLVFMDLRGGIAFCNIENYPEQRTPYGSLGVGVTLARGKTFSSHVILSYNYTKLNDVHLEDGTARIPDLQYACIRIGITF